MKTQEHPKKLQELLQRKYKIVVDPIPEDEGGGFVAYHPELGKNIFLGDGETIDEAIDNLAVVKQEWFEIYIDRGIDVPKPTVEQPVEDFSGRFVFRASRTLHRTLSHQAKDNGVSLNTWITQLLVAASTSAAYESQLERCYLTFQKNLWYAAHAGAFYTMSNQVQRRSPSPNELPIPSLEMSKAA